MITRFFASISYFILDLLMGVSESYNVITSRQIAADPNVPGFLLTLSRRGIIPPADGDLWPGQEYLKWHRREWRLA